MKFLKAIIKYFIDFIINQLILIKYSNKVRFGKNVIISKDCSFEGNNSIWSNSRLNSCIVAKGTYMGENTALKNVKIGKYCSLGSNIMNLVGRHPTSKFVSTHPCFFSTGMQAGFTYVKVKKFEELVRLENGHLVDIGNDVWIGDNVTFLDGVVVGDGAIIGANALVTKNVEPYSINGGVPSKLIKYRFDEKQRIFLLKFKWWNKDEAWIRKNANLFSDIEGFQSFFENEA